MTIPNWGRITPSQMHMLLLAGHVIRPVHVPPGTVEADEDRLEAMRRGRDTLARLTGRDFGYDLARWHAFLTEGHDVWGYRHPYCWRVVKRAIEDSLGDEDRLRLATILGEEGDDFGS